MIFSAAIHHRGTFNMSETTETWKAFTPTKKIITQRPRFLWDACMSMSPGVNTYVRVAFIPGKGILQAALFKVLPVASDEHRCEIAEGKLGRFFAVAAWYLAALLLFRSHEEDLIVAVRAEARGRSPNEKMVRPTRERRWSNYELRNGMRIPGFGAVAWLLRDGPEPYWRRSVTSIACKSSEAGSAATSINAMRDKKPDLYQVSPRCSPVMPVRTKKRSCNQHVQRS